MNRVSPLEAEFVTLIRQLPEVEVGKHFHNINFTVRGKVFAFIKRGALVLKLPADRAAALIAAGQASPLTMGKRTMREWIVLDCVSIEACQQRSDLFLESIAYCKH